MLFPTKAHSGKTLTMMDMATTNSLHSKEMLVLTYTEPVSKIDLDALMEMEMDIQTKEMHSLLTKTNGQTPILTEGRQLLLRRSTIYRATHINQRGDAFPMNPTQWNDTDGDGWGDNYDNASWTAIRPVDDPSTSDIDESWPGIYDSAATQVDKFPLFRYQWADSDGIGLEMN